MARGSRLVESTGTATYPAECIAEPRPFNAMLWTSEEPSTIRSFTAPRVSVAYGWLTEDGVIGVASCHAVNDTWHPGSTDAEAPPDPVLTTLQEEYGFTETFAEAQVSLWPPGNQAPSPDGLAAP